MSKFLRLNKNQRGFAHHLILPLVVVLVVASIGAYVLVKSKAATTTSVSGLFGYNCNASPVPTLKQGSTGVCVKVLQTGMNNYINAYNFLARTSVPTAGTVDGIFGSKTAAAVKFWKIKHGLPADSTAGTGFWYDFARSCLTTGGGAACFASGVYN